MTLSIVARSADGDAWGVAVASKYLACGALVPAAEAGVGAVATQSYANLGYRREGLRLLREGGSARQAVHALTAQDPGRHGRQVAMVDRGGQGAVFTGDDCHAWAGGATGAGYAIAGNLLAGPEVVAAAEDAWQGGDPDQPLARRLLAALTAGDAAGCDRRGRQSAALLVVDLTGSYGGPAAGGTDVVADLRVDSAAQPLAELGRLLDLHEVYAGTPDPRTLLALEGGLADEVRARLDRLGHSERDLSAALAGWAGLQNLSDRMVAGRIDPVVLDQLRSHSPDITDG
jgi:uncharacterized Ntn-hydrolase superfamily protein